MKSKGPDPFLIWTYLLIRQVGVTVHEMLHRLGQRHEQSRSDRDLYVKIGWENISPDSRYNYYRRLTYNRNPYDIGSVMQYVR